MASRLFLHTLLPAKYLLSRPLTERSHCSGVNFNVVVGKHKLNSWSEGESISVAAQVPHPSYRSSGTNNDFKLIFLSRQARGDVELVRLNTDDNVPQPKDGVTMVENLGQHHGTFAMVVAQFRHGGGEAQAASSPWWW